MGRTKLQKRVRWLSRLELFNALWLLFIFWYLSFRLNESIGLNSIIAMMLNGIMLLEGSFIWLSINRKLNNYPHINFIKYFNKIRIVDIVLIAVSFFSILLLPFKSSLDKFGAYLFFTLAVLEYINYFELQLMYDNKNDLKYLIQYKKLKTSKLKGYINTLNKQNNRNTTTNNGE